MKRLTIILISILIVIIIILAVDNEFHRNKPAIVDNSLQVKIDSLFVVNYVLETKIGQYKDSLNSKQKRRNVKEAKITNLKVAENEEILAIDTANSGELYNVFSGIEFKPR